MKKSAIPYETAKFLTEIYPFFHKIKTKDKEVYLIGTMHLFRKVIEMIQFTKAPILYLKPDLVLVEKLTSKSLGFLGRFLSALGKTFTEFDEVAKFTKKNKIKCDVLEKQFYSLEGMFRKIDKVFAFSLVAGVISQNLKRVKQLSPKILNKIELLQEYMQLEGWDIELANKQYEKVREVNPEEIESCYSFARLLFNNSRKGFKKQFSDAHLILRHIEKISEKEKESILKCAVITYIASKKEEIKITNLMEKYIEKQLENLGKKEVVRKEKRKIEREVRIILSESGQDDMIQKVRKMVLPARSEEMFDTIAKTNAKKILVYAGVAHIYDILTYAHKNKYGFKVEF